MEPTPQIVALRHGELAVFDQGEGTPIVLLHGFPLDHTMWQAQVRHFVDRYRMIAPDLRGFGASSLDSAAAETTSTMAEMADDVLVMYGGRAVELGSCSAVMAKPQMPYTWGLLESIPELESDPGARLLPIPGTPPSLLHPPTGCPFHPRCRFTGDVPGDLCERELPDLVPGVEGAAHLRRCHLRNPAETLDNAAKKREV